MPQNIESIIVKLKDVIKDLENLLAPEDKKLSDFEQVKKMLESDAWARAVDPALICDITSENDKIERGRGIIEFSIDKNLEGLKFLDFGCGEGYSVNAVQDKAAKAVGYDIKNFGWDKFVGNMVFTTSFDDVIKHGPYDVILMFDVLDHLQEESPINVLTKLKNVMHNESLIYCHVHPYTSKHATHLYHTINKAYLHLVFSPEELQQIVKDSPMQEFNIGVKYPLKTYASYFINAGLDVVSKKEHAESVDKFFWQPIIANRIQSNLDMPGNFPEFQLSIQFIDYVLKKANDISFNNVG